MLPSDGGFQTSFLQLLDIYPSNYKFKTIIPGAIINSVLILGIEVLLMGYVIMPCANKRQEEQRSAKLDIEITTAAKAFPEKMMHLMK